MQISGEYVHDIIEMLRLHCCRRKTKQNKTQKANTPSKKKHLSTLETLSPKYETAATSTLNCSSRVHIKTVLWLKM